MLMILALLSHQHTENTYDITTLEGDEITVTYYLCEPSPTHVSKRHGGFLVECIDQNPNMVEFSIMATRFRLRE